MHNQLGHFAICDKIVNGLPEFGTLVGQIGTSNFNRTFLDFFKHFVDIDNLVVYYFPHKKAPQCLIPTGKEENAELMLQIADLYVSEYYKYDPNKSIWGANLRSRSAKHLLINRDEVEDETYRSLFFDSTNLLEELIFAERFLNGSIHIGFHRSPDFKRFDEVDISYFKYLSSFGIACLLRHFVFSNTAKKSIGRQEKLVFIRDLLSSKAPDLSLRELDVCSRIVLGYSTLGIALELGLKECSVATMRKRGYRKMGICSQNELFEHCLDEFVRRQNVLNSALSDFKDTVS